MKQHKIRDNALKAQLRTPMFKMQQQTPKKGKGSYSRKGRNAQCIGKGKSTRGHRQAA
ncbi:alternative ribosome rescue factor ArfA [Halomonas sp. DWK9]|uniref:alternative ribosome rescue factor ArfA n=1 Tax=Halomonas sp. DWK9 TaxID=3060155 RepID=UPI00287FE28E|nr:alternative ribosome rescue factor ArfA [Halomonas sp. DWK9]